jgi:thiosulfate/3-mercaptopyruvate sulfurtransferase
MSEYPNGNMLVEVDWLKQHLQDSTLRILDVRSSDPRLPMGYRMGHIPGAIALDPTREFYARTPHGRDVATSETIASALGSRGVTNDSKIVIYDEWTGQLAAMTYWVLRMIGHRDLHILHGGWAMWQKGGGIVTQDAPGFAAVEYRAERNENLRATAEWIQANDSRQDLLLLDVRSDGEYSMGHIPGAVNLSWDVVLDPQTQTFRDSATLRKQLELVGATPDKEIVAYCASGARSSHMFATLQLLGYPRIRNYNGSMMDWLQARGLPVE